MWLSWPRTLSWEITSPSALDQFLHLHSCDFTDTDVSHVAAMYGTLLTLTSRPCDPGSLLSQGVNDSKQINVGLLPTSDSELKKLLWFNAVFKTKRVQLPLPLLPHMQRPASLRTYLDIFQHDNHPKDTSKWTKEWWQKRKIAMLEWLRQSTDLNPIENLQNDLQRALHSRSPQSLMELKLYSKKKDSLSNSMYVKLTWKDSKCSKKGETCLSTRDSGLCLMLSQGCEVLRQTWCKCTMAARHFWLVQCHIARLCTIKS